MKLYSQERLKRICPVKWHDKIPDDGISLGVADVDFEGPQGIVEYLREQLTDDFSFYQYQKGLPKTLDDISQYLKGLGIDAGHSNIQVTPGTMMGIYASMKYISRRDGKIVFAGPLYEPIHRHGVDNHNEFEFVNIEVEGLNHDMMINAVDNNTKMIAINNPSNPNGYVYSMDDLKLIRDLVVDNDIICFVDELYQPLVFDRSKNKHVSPVTLDGMADRTIALYGFSKAYGLAGYRSGFMYLGNKVAEEINFIINSQMVAPSPISSLVASWALTSESSKHWVSEFRAEMESRTKFAAEQFNDRGYECIVPDSCFFIYPDIRTDDVEFSERLLEKKGVQVVPGSVFGPTGKNHLRINCATSEERLGEGLIRIFDTLQNM